MNLQCVLLRSKTFITENIVKIAFSVPCKLSYENFPGHRFETQIHIRTQIRINTIFTLATKHLIIINKDNLCLHLKAF